MGPNGEEVDTAAIVTTDANRLLAPIHDRMPVILRPDAFEMWLDTGNVDVKTAAALIAPAQNELFEAYEITPLVNRVANDGPEVQVPFTAPDVVNVPSPPPTPKKAARKRKPDEDQVVSVLDCRDVFGGL